MNKMFSGYQELCFYYGLDFGNYINDDCDIDVNKIRRDVRAESIESIDALVDCRVIPQIIVSF